MTKDEVLAEIKRQDELILEKEEMNKEYAQEIRDIQDRIEMRKMEISNLQSSVNLANKCIDLYDNREDEITVAFNIAAVKAKAAGVMTYAEFEELAVECNAEINEAFQEGEKEETTLTAVN